MADPVARVPTCTYRPVDMLTMHDPGRGVAGDCLRAAVASVFGLDADEVPHFAQIGTDQGDTDDEGYGWWDALRDWLAKHGLDVWYCVAEHLPRYRDASAMSHILADGRSPRGNGDLWHCVVVDLDGEMCHDPHPSRDGVLDVQGYYLFVPADHEEIPASESDGG